MFAWSSLEVRGHCTLAHPFTDEDDVVRHFIHPWYTDEWDDVWMPYADPNNDLVEIRLS
jgi:hypothetical protein